ncbi:hypothetical protein E5672_19550 [Alteromonas portus]|uniref:Uncharacterized protein n=1 Tax=Alteromonas portus TaxID=2565549 RepID=A0A4U0ZC82_9ALTE|nr:MULTISPECIES: hypothetical protein [Alteromonas]MCZ8531712.1 hypothetical protein [Alteromonas sp. PRIM-21]TKB00683.1 hypothetical protein E5672_19550 [Alteromonas portus]
MKHSFYFKSSEIKIIDGEDDETNPMRYGKSLAEWISNNLNDVGFTTKAFPEDWGWRIDCMEKPCPIWIGCGNVDEIDSNNELKPPTNESVVWHCFIEADIPFFRNLFNKINPTESKEKVATALAKLLSSAGHIKEVSEP